MTVYRACYRYLRERRHELRAETRRHHRDCLARFAHTVGADREVRRLKRGHVLAWIDSMNVQPSTLRSQLSIVRGFTRWAVEHDLVKKDPCLGIRPPTATQTNPRRLNGGEVRALLEHAPDSRARVMVLLGVQEGLRRGEIAGLRVEDIDFHDRLVNVEVGSKGGKQRIVPLSDETASAVRAYLGEYPAGSGPLLRSFTRPARGIGAPAVQKVVHDLMVDAGVKTRPHDGRSTHALRHTSASDIVDNGADVRDLQEFLGHSHAQTTMIYLRRKAAMGRVRKVVEGRTYGDDEPHTWSAWKVAA